MMEGVDSMAEVVPPAMDESFCIVDRKDAVMQPSAPPAASAAAVSSTPLRTVDINQSSSLSMTSPPALGQGSPQVSRPIHMATQGQATAASGPLNTMHTPQRGGTSSVAPHASAPPQMGPPTDDAMKGQQMSALHGNPHPEPPAAYATSSRISTSADGSFHGAYGQTPQFEVGTGTASAPPGYPSPGGVHATPGYQQPLQYGFDPSPGSGSSYGGGMYGQQQPSQYGSGSSQSGDSGLWGWFQSTTNSVVESATRMVNQPDLIVEGAQRLGRNLVDKTKVQSFSFRNIVCPPPLPLPPDPMMFWKVGSRALPGSSIEKNWNSS